MPGQTYTVEAANALVEWVTGLVEEARSALVTLQEIETQTRSNGHGSPEEYRARIEAVLTELSDADIVLRDIERGLVDFPARSTSGRDYWLCWIVGEPSVQWWHWPDAGFAGRTPLEEPPA